MTLPGSTSEITEKRIVLVVDDTPDNLSIMSGLLKLPSPIRSHN